MPYFDQNSVNGWGSAWGWTRKLVAGEGEVEGGAQAGRLTRLEDVRRALEEDLDAAGPQAVADVLEPLVREPLGGVLLGIGVLHDVDRLFLLLQRADDLLHVRLAVGQERRDHVLPGGADRQAVGRLVVRPERQALPHRGRLRVADPAAVVAGVLAVGDLLDPVGEAAHELPIVVRVAGREVEVPFRRDGPAGA